MNLPKVITDLVEKHFPGSPIVMSYDLTLKDGLIQSLKITG